MTSRPIVTAGTMRAAEARAIAAGTTVESLMDRAGLAVAEAAWRFGGKREVLVLCGPGNNGGDGYVAARALKARGAKVRVAALGDPRTPAAIAARGWWDGPVESLDTAASAPVLVDALFGTGLSRALDEDVATPFAALVEAASFSIAVDIPSGLGTDDGALLAPVPAFDLTLALGALKPAHRLQPAASLCGRVIVADIGIPIQSQWSELSPPTLTAPGPGDHKYSRGMALVIGGGMPGAARLAATAALRSGAGIVRLYGGQGGPDALICRPLDDLQAGLEDSRTHAVLIGPGFGADDDDGVLFDRALDSGRALIIDAGAIRMMRDKGLDRLAALPCMAILTPHDGEFDALFGAGTGSKINRALAAARQSGAVIVHKGPDTVIAAPDGQIAIAPPNSSWLSTGGTGDVLAGIITAMRARGLDAFAAAAAGVWLHAEVARRAGPAFIADDLAKHLPAAIASSL